MSLPPILHPLNSSRTSAPFPLDRGKGGVLCSPSAFFMKHPPEQFSDDDGFRMTEEFIAGKRDS